jgi:hypothetical protein
MAVDPAGNVRDVGASVPVAGTQVGVKVTPVRNGACWGVTPIASDGPDTDRSVGKFVSVKADGETILIACGVGGW